MKKLGVAAGDRDRLRRRGARGRSADQEGSAPPPPANCFSSVWAYMNSTAADCPLTWGPFTAYATLDLGLGYESNGAAWNNSYPNGVANFISKQSYGPKWLWTPNGISQSVIGIKVNQPVAYGWSIVGTAETGFDPLSWNLANGQRSQAQNNGLALPLQSANGDSGRSGQWDNSQGFVGISNKTYGTLVGGPRQHARAGRPRRLRSDGQRLRLLAVRLFRLLRRLRRHRAHPLQHRAQISPGVHEFPRGGPCADRQLQPGQRLDLDVSGPDRRQTSPISLAAAISAARFRSTRSAPTRKTR